MDSFPDGINERHGAPRPGRRLLNWAGFAVLFGILCLALSGAFGGGSRPVREAESSAARLSVKTPAVIRNGMFFEMAVDVRASRPIAKPVIAVPESYWRDITINTIEPQAASEKSENGMFLFEFDPMEPGDLLQLKFDGQVNPSLFGGTEGTLELRDDKTRLAAIPLKLRVMP